MDAETQALRHELDAALADLEEAATLGEINQTLVDMLEVLKKRPELPTPEVTVNVSPTPINNVVTVERGGFKITFDYDHGRVVGGTVVPMKATK